MDTQSAERKRIVTALGDVAHRLDDLAASCYGSTRLRAQRAAGQARLAATLMLQGNASEEWGAFALDSLNRYTNMIYAETARLRP